MFSAFEDMFFPVLIVLCEGTIVEDGLSTRSR